MDDIEPLRNNFIADTAGTEEQCRLLRWLTNNPGKRASLFREKDLYQAASLKGDFLNRREEEAWDQLKKKIDPPVLSHPDANGYMLRRVVRAAALVVLSLLTGWVGNSMYHGLQTRNNHHFEQTVTAGKGQIVELFLADGTHVWLNAESKLEFPGSFSASKRVVRLEGEAYFEVRSDPDHPFYVHSDNQQVKVTGTRFNIKRYPEDHKIETVLEEGKVKVLGVNVVKDLLPGQRSSFNTESMEVVIDPVDIDVYTSWHEGRYEFKNASFSKIMKIVERWWDVEVIYDREKLKDFTFSGVLKKHKEVGYIFEIINQFKPIDYQVDQNKIIVNVK